MRRGFFQKPHEAAFRLGQPVAAAPFQEIARQSLRKDFRNIKPESARILLIEGSPHVLGTFPAHPFRRKGWEAPTRTGT